MSAVRTGLAGCMEESVSLHQQLAWPAALLTLYADSLPESISTPLDCVSDADLQIPKMS